MSVARLSGGDAAHMALVARERAYRQAIAALYYRAGEHQAESERATRAAAECMATASSVLEYALRQHREHMAVWRVATDMWDALNAPTYMPVRAR